MDLKIGSTFTGKPMMPRRTLRTGDYTTITKRWNEHPSYRETEQVHGWTLEYCIFLDYINKVVIKYEATREKKNSMPQSIRIEVESRP